MAILTVENLGHSFGDRTLFKDVSFRLVEGDHIGLVGANGVGKSTLMSIITGQAIHKFQVVRMTLWTHLIFGIRNALMVIKMWKHPLPFI